MNKIEASQLAVDVSNIAADILLQLNKNTTTPSIVEKYYLGLLQRERIILRDISIILKNNSEQKITSAFILFRVLLDDFIRLFNIYTSKNMQEEVIKINADAYNHWFKTIKETIEINDCFFNGKHPYLFTKEKFDEEKLKFSNNTENERFFSDKLNFKFKKLSPISEVFKLMRSSVKTEGNIDSYLIYKLLSQYVHFSNIAFNIDNNPETRKAELDQIEHILIFCYKMLLMHFDFFCRSYQIVLNNNKIKDFIDSKMKNV